MSYTRNKKIGKNDTRFALTNKAYNGTMASQLTWSDNAQKFFGQIKTNTYRKLSPTGQHIISTDILPTDITISDSTWLVNGGNVSFSDRRVDVSGIRISHRDQSLSLGGSLTSSLQDSIKVQLHRIDVGFILNLINLQPVSFSGLATGSIYAGKDVGGNFLIDGRLNVPDFHFNEGKMGDAAVNLKFSTGNKRLYINADMQEDQVSRTQVNGYVGIAEKALDLHVQSQNTNLHFCVAIFPIFLVILPGVPPENAVFTVLSRNSTLKVMNGLGWELRYWLQAVVTMSATGE